MTSEKTTINDTEEAMDTKVEFIVTMISELL